MTGEMVPLVVLPRFTSYVGAGTFSTAPMDVSEFTGGEVTFWRGPLVGGAAMAPFTTHFEGSHDALNWTAVSPPVTSANASSWFALPFPKRWFRVRVVLQADGSGVVGISLWLAGAIERRNPTA